MGISRGRDRAQRRQPGDFGIRFYNPATRLPSGARRCRAYRRIRQRSLKHPALRMNRRGLGRASARAAGSRRAVCPFDEIGENPIAGQACHRRRETHNQTDNRRVSRDRSRKRRHMTSRARLGRIAGKLRFVLFVVHVVRPRLRGSEWKRPGATNDYAAVRHRQ